MAMVREFQYFRQWKCFKILPSIGLLLLLSLGIWAESEEGNVVGPNSDVSVTESLDVEPGEQSVTDSTAKKNAQTKEQSVEKPKANTKTNANAKTKENEKGKPASRQMQVPAVKQGTQAKEAVSDDLIRRYRMHLQKASWHLKRSEFGLALEELAEIPQGDFMANVYHRLLEAEAWEGLGRKKSADSIYQMIHLDSLSKPFRSFLFERRFSLYPESFSSDTEALNFLQKIVEEDVPARVKYEAYLEVIRINHCLKPTKACETILSDFFKQPYGDVRLDSILKKVSSFKASGGDALAWQLSLLEIEEKRGQVQNALERSKKILDENLPRDIQKKMEFNYANLLWKTKSYKLSIRRFKSYLKNYGDEAEAIYQVARLYDKMGYAEDAKRWYTRHLETFPSSARAAGVTWVSAWNAESNGNYPEAIAGYTKVMQDFPWYAQATWAAFRIGYCYYKSTDFTKAFEFFDKAFAGAKSTSVACASLFWSGKAALAKGDTLNCIIKWKIASIEYPFDFYGHLSVQRLKDVGKADSWETRNNAIFSASQDDTVKVWMQARLNGYSQDLGLNEGSEYIDIQGLLTFRLDTLAVLTLQSILNSHKSNPWFLYQYARLFNSFGVEVEGYNLGRRLSWQFGVKPLGRTPKKVIQLLYPQPYNHLVFWNCALKGLEPELVYGLMKQESAFDANISSPAGAIGLMQIIPPTGKMLAAKEQLDDFESNDLRDPQINIRLGTTYLRDLARDFKGEWPYVLANYNAGPAAAKRWQKASSGKPLEVLCEEISYAETRDYVKKVMGNYWTYQLLRRSNQAD